jgi:hypothetical protein
MAARPKAPLTAFRVEAAPVESESLPSFLSLLLLSGSTTLPSHEILPLVSLASL